MTTILDPLIHSPQLSRYVEQLRGLLDEEQQRREAFYAWVTEDHKAEFVNGEVVVHSPVKLCHDQASSELAVLLFVHISQQKLGLVAHTKLMISLTRNDYEPDICFFRAERAGGFTPDQMRFPAPDFVVEVLSPSTEAHDRGVKFEDYAAHGVAEYWLIDADAETVEQYLLEGETYILQIKARSGVITSPVIAGFEIPIRAIFDPAEHTAALRQLLTDDGRRTVNDRT